MMMLRRDRMFPLAALERMDAMRDQINQIFEPVLRSAAGAPSGGTGDSWLLPLELAETDTAYRVKVMIPGIPPEGIQVHATGKTLVVEGNLERQERQDDGEWTHLSEFQYGKFTRALEFKDPIVTEAIEATYANGLLTLTVPKEKEAQKKSVKVMIQS